MTQPHTSNTQQYVLAGDTGGTKTRLGIFAPGKTRPVARIEKTYPSKSAPSLECLVHDFLTQSSLPVTAACFGIPGPVIRGHSKATNLPWDVSEKKMKKQFGWPVARLVNDLTATATAVPLLRKSELCPLNNARAVKGQDIVLIAPGTGLGQALLLCRDGEYCCMPSEGGHADFAPNSPDETDLWAYLHRRYGHVSAERVLSGSGQVNIYEWLRDSGRYKEPQWLAEEMKKAEPASVVSRMAASGRSPLCAAAEKQFVSIFGSVAGNLALTGMALGGVYLGGGIPPRILGILQDGVFMKAFTAKGRFKNFMEKIPVRVILNDNAALLGAAYCALQLT
jgi:glucokinase